MKIEINLPQIFDRGVCKIKGHDWTQWIYDTEKVSMWRECKRCGEDEEIHGVKPK